MQETCSVRIHKNDFLKSITVIVSPTDKTIEEELSRHMFLDVDVKGNRNMEKVFEEKLKEIEEQNKGNIRYTSKATTLYCDLGHKVFEATVYLNRNSIT
jgi:hypothetical protein